MDLLPVEMIEKIISYIPEETKNIRIICKLWNELSKNIEKHSKLICLIISYTGSNERLNIILNEIKDSIDEIIIWTTQDIINQYKPEVLIDKPYRIYINDKFIGTSDIFNHCISIGTNCKYYVILYEDKIDNISNIRNLCFLNKYDIITIKLEYNEYNYDKYDVHTNSRCFRSDKGFKFKGGYHEYLTNANYTSKILSQAKIIFLSN